MSQYCAVDQQPCSGSCREKNTDASGGVCCSECFPVDQILSRAEMERRGMVKKRVSKQHRRPERDEEERD